jgi:hypothetical protein
MGAHSVAIPTAIIGLFGVLMFFCWLFAECRDSHRLARIGLSFLCIVALVVAASNSQSGPLYFHRQLLTAIDRELADGEPSRVRHAVSIYDRTFESTHDFGISTRAAANELYERRTPGGWKAKK